MLKKQYLKTKPVCKVTFVLPKEAAPEAGEIRLLGDFNGWKYENGIVMEAKKSEYRTTMELETGRTYEFRYLVDGERWVNDWKADDYVSSPFQGIDNSVVKVEAIDIPQSKKPIKSPKKLSSASKKTEKPSAKTTPKAGPKKVAKAKPGKAKTTKQVGKKKDDLRRIEGIGPKIAGLLEAGGIHSFSALAEADNTLLKEILEKAGPRYKMHDPTTWKDQARLAASSEWEKLEKLQKELKGGRRKK